MINDKIMTLYYCDYCDNLWKFDYNEFSRMACFGRLLGTYVCKTRIYLDYNNYFWQLKKIGTGK